MSSRGSSIIIIIIITTVILAVAVVVMAMAIVIRTGEWVGVIVEIIIIVSRRGAAP